MAAPTGLRALLEGPERDGTLLGVFPSARYYLVDTATVFALLTPDATRLPCGVVLPTELPDGPLRIGGRVVSIGGISLRVGRWVSASVPRVGPLADVPIPVPHVEGLAAHQPQGFADGSAAAALVGRGPGLTPAGDDVLAGYLAAAGSFGVTAAPLRDAVARLAPSRTTALSATLLRHAAIGEAIPQVSKLIFALGVGWGIASAVEELRLVGHTSGTGLLAGVLLAAYASTRIAARQ